MIKIKFEYGFENMPTKNIHKEYYSLLDIENGKPLQDADKNLEYRLKYRRQYTGLKDKNSVEIYESDIVKDDEGRFFEVKEDLRFAKTGYIMSCIKNKLNDHINLGGFYDFWSWMYPDNYIEVIGNIYQNPELLKEGI